MFKHASIFKITLPQPMLVATLSNACDAVAFTPCGASQEKSVGWVPPRGHEHGDMVENVGGHLILSLMIETKSVPTQAIADHVAAKTKYIEATTGRKPGKKERKELKEDAKLALLPMAFARRSSVLVWIDTSKGMLVIDATSQSTIDEVTTQLVNLMVGVAIQYISTVTSPSAAMADWLVAPGGLQNGFDIGRACNLKASDETKAVVRYTRHNLDTDEVRQHIGGGKLPTALALTYNDRVAFTLTDAGALTGINFLDPVFENATQSDIKADAFDADVTILTAELGLLITDLVEALGGEVVAAEGPQP